MGKLGKLFRRRACLSLIKRDKVAGEDDQLHIYTFSFSINFVQALLEYFGKHLAKELKIKRHVAVNVESIFKQICPLPEYALWSYLYTCPNPNQDMEAKTVLLTLVL